MIDWVHELCRDWGAYMRKHPKLLPSKNHVWRMWKELGASGGDFGPSNPDWDADRDVIELHRVFRQMPVELSELMLVFYVRKAAPADKAKELGLSVTQMYERRSQAHYFILGRLSDEKDSGIFTPQNKAVAVC